MDPGVDSDVTGSTGEWILSKRSEQKNSESTDRVGSNIVPSAEGSYSQGTLF